MELIKINQCKYEPVYFKFDNVKDALLYEK